MCYLDSGLCNLCLVGDECPRCVYCNVQEKDIITVLSEEGILNMCDICYEFVYRTGKVKRRARY